uniref:Transposase n=1 Tax=Acrobeloides nanus TaxID=290746 RepID=A0A914EKD7_9BILA
MHQGGIPKQKISRLLDIPLTTVVFVKQGVKIDRYVYMGMLEDHLIPWAREHFDDTDWCFQQDSAPEHKAFETQEWLAEECPLISFQETTDL